MSDSSSLHESGVGVCEAQRVMMLPSFAVVRMVLHEIDSFPGGGGGDGGGTLVGACPGAKSLFSVLWSLVSAFWATIAVRYPLRSGHFRGPTLIRQRDLILASLISASSLLP